MPISRITLLVVSVAGTRCEASVDRPMAAITEESASSTGTPAAISAPNATIRIASVTGRLRISARWKSSPRVSSSALLIDWPPTCSTRRSGCGRLHGGGRVEQRPHPLARGVRVAGHRHRHQQRRAVVRRHRLPHARHVRQCLQPLGGVRRGRLRRRLVERPGPRGDQHVVDRRVREVAGGRDRVGPTRLADPLVRVGRLVQSRRGAADEADRHEHDPQRHGPPRVLGTPPRHPYGHRSPDHHLLPPETL